MKATLILRRPLPGVYPARISGYLVKFSDGNDIFECLSETGVRGYNVNCFVTITEDPMTGQQTCEVEY